MRGAPRVPVSAVQHLLVFNFLSQNQKHRYLQWLRAKLSSSGEKGMRLSRGISGVVRTRLVGGQDAHVVWACAHRFSCSGLKHGGDEMSVLTWLGGNHRCQNHNAVPLENIPWSGGLRGRGRDYRYCDGPDCIGIYSPINPKPQTLNPYP